ncbi:unnamed protein product [Brassica napus]|nr:unnamed protein product [Brassica napus]
MDNNNLIPSLPKGEPAMDTCDWRAQLPSDSREKIIGKIMETLRKQLPYSGTEEIKELRRIASRFEERIFGCAANPMLTMETTKLQSAASSYSLPLNPGWHQMTIEGPIKAEPAVNTSDWRTCLPPDSLCTVCLSLRNSSYLCLLQSQLKAKVL